LATNALSLSPTSVIGDADYRLAWGKCLYHRIYQITGSILLIFIYVLAKISKFFVTD